MLVALLFIAFVPLYIFFVGALRGMVLCQLWLWFVVPLFPSAPHLSILAAIGLSMTLMQLLALDNVARTNLEKPDMTKGTNGEKLWVLSKLLAKPITQYFWVLVFGWVIHHFLA